MGFVADLLNTPTDGATVSVRKRVTFRPLVNKKIIYFLVRTMFSCIFLILINQSNIKSCHFKIVLNWRPQIVFECFSATLCMCIALMRPKIRNLEAEPFNDFKNGPTPP
jgi:hypothetical protein